MSDLYDPLLFSSSGPVRMAYTLDNTQPVRCTLVSEEPLFYLDTTPAEFDELEEFDLDDLELLQAFEKKLNNLSSTKDNHENPEETVYHISPETISLFKEQFGLTDNTAKQSSLDDCLSTIRLSRMGSSLLDFIQSNDIKIVQSKQIPSMMYDRMNGVISVRNTLSKIEKTLLIIREIRRVYQQKQGALIHPLLFHPDHSILVNRIQVADLMTNMIRMAWEIKLAGISDLWTYLDEKGYNDLTRTFSREALADFRSLSNGRAMAATFEAWFMSERCRAFDRVLIQQMLADYQSYVHSAGHVDTSRILSNQMISALGAQPYGNNYLSAHTATILGDPIFTEIRDRSNANFLWFIKFEQSFRQTERDLQQGDVTSSSSALSNHDKSTTATILVLPVEKSENTFPQKFIADGSGGSTRVVDLQGWRTRHNDAPART